MIEQSELPPGDRQIMNGSAPVTAQVSPGARSARSGRRYNWPHIFWWSVLNAGIVLAPFTFSWSGLGICLGLYLATGFGVTMGYHRLLTHRSFQTPRIIEYLLAALGSLSNQGGPLQWVAVHRVHHQHGDTEDDPHSPRHGFWWAHMLWWMPKVPRLNDPTLYQRYVADLVKDPVHRALQRGHVLMPVLLAGLLFGVGQACGGLGWSWLVWGMFVRTSLVHHATWLVNSATHLWGYRTYATGDDSTNLWWVAILSLGEGWHNNHHAFPRSARHGLRWWEIDLTYWLIRSMSWIGLAKQIHVPGRVLRPVAASSQS